MNKPKKIICIGDIHIFNGKRFEEHKHVFSNFYKILDDEKPHLVVITGDVIDSKLRLSPEQIQLCRDLFINILNRCPAIMIPGNHDTALNTKDRLDSLTPIVESVRNETTYRLDYLKESGLYQLHGLQWAVWSCMEDQLSPFKPNSLDFADFGLYHGVIEGSTTNSNFKLDGGISIDEFRQCNQVIASDIHKVQSFRDGEIRYTGSFIQVDVTEEMNGTCLIYELVNDNKLPSDYKARYREIQNDYSTINISMDDVTVNPGPNQRIRLKYDTDKHSMTSANEMAKKLKTDHNINVSLQPIIKRKEVFKPIIVAKSDDPNVDYFNDFIKAYGEKLGIKDFDQDIVALKEMDKNFSHGEIREFELGDYSVDGMVINNMLSFGPSDTTIDLSNEGLIGIFGKNRSGKSSVIKIMQFVMFNDTPNGVSPLKMINKHNRNKTAKATVYFSKMGKRYSITRTLTPDKKSSTVKNDVRFHEIDDQNVMIFDHTKESRVPTEAEINKYLSISDMFEMLSVFSAQKRQTEFIDCKNADRLKMVNKFLGLQEFELKEKNVLEQLKQENAVYASLSKQFEKEVNIQSLSNDLKNKNILLKIAKADKLEYSSDLEELELDYKDIITVYNSNLKVISKKVAEPSEINDRIESLKNESNTLKQKIVDNIEQSKLHEETINEEIAEFQEKHGIKPIDIDYSAINKQQTEYTSEIAVKKHEIGVLNKQRNIDICNSCGKEFTEKDKESVLAKMIDLESDQIAYQVKFALNEIKIKEYKTAEFSIINKLNTIDTLIEKDNVRLEGKIKDCTITINNLQSQLLEYSNVAAAKEANEMLASTVKRYNDEKQQLTSELALTNANIGVYESDIRTIETRIKQYTERIKELEALEETIRLLKAYRKVVNKDGLPLFILRNKITEINDRINMIVNQVFDFSVDFFIDEEKGELRIHFGYEDDADKNEVGMASGSETFVINLCIKVGLAQISSLPKIDTIFIDEGYDSLDSDTIERLPQLFAVLAGCYRNVITISHLDLIKDMCSHQIKLGKKNDYTVLI